MPAHHFKILIAEPNADNIERLKTNLEAEGYFVEHVTNGSLALEIATASPPDLLIANWMLPGLTGLELCRMLRLGTDTMSIPIFLLGFGADASVQPRSRRLGVSAFFEGEDIQSTVYDEVIENFGPYINASQTQPLKAAGLVIEPTTKTVYRAGQALRLSPKEFKLLTLLMQKNERVVSRSQIIEFVWDPDALIDDRTVDVLVGRLRRALSQDSHGNPIESLRGKGYKLVSVLAESP